MDYSIVCPFYNEEQILETAIRNMVSHLQSLDGTWEFIVVNDGSTDGSGAIARQLAQELRNLHLIEYPHNRGRGYALRTGIASARGKIIVTTEIDLSWGEDIVHELIAAMEAWPDVDIVVASPNLPQGGYKNVPRRRVWASKIGNRVIRACIANAATMNTGMTRAYRRQVIQSLPLVEDRKEFHLEVILKASTLGYKIREIPATLEWKEYKHQGQRIKRKSSSKVNKLVVTHSLFSLFANPIRYVWGFSFACFFMGLIWLVWAAILFYSHRTSAFVGLMSVLLIVLGILLFVMGVVLQQGNMIQRELWILQRSLKMQNSRTGGNTNPETTHAEPMPEHQLDPTSVPVEQV